MTHRIYMTFGLAIDIQELKFAVRTSKMEKQNVSLACQTCDPASGPSKASHKFCPKCGKPRKTATRPMVTTRYNPCLQHRFGKPGAWFEELCAEYVPYRYTIFDDTITLYDYRLLRVSQKDVVLCFEERMVTIDGPGGIEESAGNMCFRESIAGRQDELTLLQEKLVALNIQTERFGAFYTIRKL